MKAKDCKTRFFQFHEKSTHGIFLIFCIKLPQHEAIRLTWMIFQEKSFFQVFGSTLAHWAQNKVFQILTKNNTQKSSDFLHKVRVASKLKIGTVGKSCFEVFWL